MRKAIADYQRAQDKKHQKDADSIKKLYFRETGNNIEPTETDIKKIELWEEQSHKCLYTGAEIGIADFLGDNPKYDIEHTIPRSAGGDSTMENLTLCDSNFNRNVKKTQLPAQLANHEEILTRIEGWKKRYETLTSQMDKCRTFSGMAKDIKDSVIQKRHKLKMERDYWKGKYERFTMTEVPDGFSRRQGAGIGLVSKYAGLYLKSLFHDPHDRSKSRVFTVKGTTTAEFRRMWGLQNEYEKKSRDNHCHHCIDAITIACIGKQQYEAVAKFYRDEALYDDGRGKKPQFRKPWPTFTEDVLSLERTLLVVHETPDNMPRKARKYVKTNRGEFLAKGDCARGSLHNDTYYGAIERDGKIRYVVRKPLSSFEKESDIDNIVDDTVKEIVREAVRGKNFKEAISQPVYMNKEKGILIKKVRCYAPKVLKIFSVKSCRDSSSHQYKDHIYVANDRNYAMAIYEKGVDKKIRFEIVKNIEAANFYKKSMDREEYPYLVPQTKNGAKIKYYLKRGMAVLLYQNDVEEIDFNNMKDIIKRLYYITGLSLSESYGMVTLTHAQEARDKLEPKKGAFKMGEIYRPKINLRQTQFQGLIEGIDFNINILGELKPIKR